MKTIAEEMRCKGDEEKTRLKLDGFILRRARFE